MLTFKRVSGILFSWEVIMLTIAKSRGSQCLAGAAPLEHRMPAVDGGFPFPDIAQWVEQQRRKLSAAGSNPAIPTA